MNKNTTYKVVDLFGNETLMISQRKKPNKTLFDDYDSFIEKFEPKKTTDDCYTPKDVYTTILDYVDSKIDLSILQI